MTTHFTVQSSATTECVPLFAAKMQIMMIMIKIMKNNGLHENNK